MEIVARITRSIVGSFAATRYLSSLGTGGIILLYAILWLAGYVPAYGDLSARVGVSMAALLALVYLLTVAIAGFLWYFLNQTHDPSSRFRRAIYRQTDVSGLYWLNTLMILMTMITVYLVRNYDEAERNVVVLMAVLVLIPVVIDFIPIGRPRRLLFPENLPKKDDKSARNREALEVLLESSFEQYGDLTIADLEAYGEWSIVENEKTGELPDGMFVEIPPG